MPMKMLRDAHDYARAQFDKISSQSRQLSLVGDQIAELSKLGPMIEHEDVIDAAGKLVASGIDPHRLAGMLAEMPTANGPAIQQWLGTQAAMVYQAQQALAPLHEAARQQLATSALGVLMGHHMGLPGGGPPGAPQTPPGPSNALTSPSPGPSGPPAREAGSPTPQLNALSPTAGSA